MIIYNNCGGGRRFKRLKKSTFKLPLSIIFFLFFITANAAPASQNDSTRIIIADISQVKGPRSKVYQEIIAAGRANEGLRADWQQQLAMVKKEIGFKYIRFHGLLSDDMHVYTEDANGNPIYNFQYVDKVYDYLLSIHLRPFVELGFMPPALASTDKTVFWWKGNISTPKSYDKWAALIVQLVKHFELRYSKPEVEKWYFEVWNEPNLNEFFTGSREDYFKLYEVTAKAIKSVSPSYRVGGPATSSSTWMKETLAYFGENKIPVDFISTHAYGTKTVLDQFGKEQTKMREPDGIPIPIRKLRTMVDNSLLKGKEIHITEWNSSSSPRDPIHDTYQNATFILNTLKKTEGLVNSMAYWTFTDIFEEAGPPVTPFHGGFGLLNLQGIKKPSFFAYQFLNNLADTELVNNDPASWATKDAANNIRLLFWDYKLSVPDSLSNQQYYGRSVLPADKGTVRIVLKNLKPGKYKMQIYRIGYNKNDAYSAWLKMGSPANLSPQQEKSLKTIAAGLPETEKIITVLNGSFSQNFPVRDNDVYFFKLNGL